ncbi:MAG: anti-sigma F factor [Erysipelotrichaceae bacterium]
MNKMILKFLSRYENDSFARTTAIAFLMPLDPTLEEIMEIKTIISEGVINAILHGYNQDETKLVKLEIAYDTNSLVTIIISDEGVGIEDINLAMQPLYSSKAYLERSGMGITIMENFADSFDIVSTINKGTKIIIQKQLNSNGKLK